MADDNEEDIFADLYDGEESGLGAPQATSSAPPPVVAPEPVAEAPPAPQQDPTEDSDMNNADNMRSQADEGHDGGPYGGNSYDAQGFDGSQQMPFQNWNNNGNNNGGNNFNQGHGSQQQDQGGDYERPIGTKEDGKMFIGGLNWETTDQSLKDYFSQFGEVIECTVMRDNASGRSRGFGFLTFRDPKCVNSVMVKEHQLDGKIIDPKRAIPRDEQERTSKIFVGGVSQEASEQDFKQFFMNFGRVLDATLMMDKDTGRPRGFGFVTFDSEAAVDRTLQGPLEILGKPIEVKKAQPRGNMRDDNDGNRGNNFRKNDRFNRDGGQGFNNNQGNDMSGAASGMAGGAQMSQAQMAQYWAKMQAYFRAMQQMNSGMGNPMMGGQANPMMQQMMAMQGMQNNMNPQMMQQMQNMQMQNMQGGYPGMGQNTGMMSPQGGNGNGNGGGGNRPGFSPQEQMAFEQQKYERQQGQRSGSGFTPNPAGAASPSSNSGAWEGMYDDVPAPMGPGGGRGGFQNQNRRGGRGSQGPTPQPQQQMPVVQAPINAPTGPKNAGRPGANYRGGGRGGHRGNFHHPYGRGGNGGG